MHYIKTFHFLLIFMVIGATCLLLNLIAITSRQYFLLIVCQIIIMSLLICGYNSRQDLEKCTTFRPIDNIYQIPLMMILLIVIFRFDVNLHNASLLISRTC